MDDQNGARANGGGSAKKRLLPMELRRRRRAAKLQITSDRDVTTISARDIINDLNDRETTSEDSGLNAGDDPMKKPITAPQPLQQPQPIVDQPVLLEERKAFDASTTTALAIPADSTTNNNEAPVAELPAIKTTSTTKKLQNLFSFSLLDRKRQKLQHRESLVDVPLSMQVDRVPLDLAPKCKVVITTSFPFPFARPRARSMAAAMGSDVSDSEEVRWLRALQYYVHPASPLPPSLTVTNEKQLEENEFYIQRLRTWQASFRHAYFGFRRLPHNGTLYVRYPEFIACFYIDTGVEKNKTSSSSPSLPSLVDLCRLYVSNREPRPEEEDTTSTSPRPSKRRICAVISQSNARLRKDLQHRNVAFCVPFNIRAMQKPVSELELHGDGDHRIRVSTSLGSEQNNVHGPDSLLHFSGHQAVHGLYEFLLNRKPHSNQDVPEITAHHPFANAAIRSVAVRYMGKATGTGFVGAREDGAAATGGGAQAPPGFRSEIELTGFCVSTTVAKFISCLEDYATNHERDGISALKIAMETAPLCERLNALSLDSSVLDAPRKQTVEERDKWKQQLDFAKRRLQTIKKTAGNVDVEMTTR